MTTQAKTLVNTGQTHQTERSVTFTPMNHQGVFALPLVKVKEKFQITLPAELREVLHLAVGDLLEATIEDNVIVLKPKVVVDREQAWAKMEHAMASVEDRAPNPQQSPQAQEEEIAEIIKEYRKDKHAQRRP
jgi:AbrB family looped-hinge helix DNA binding protein